MMGNDFYIGTVGGFAIASILGLTVRYIRFLFGNLLPRFFDRKK